VKVNVERQGVTAQTASGADDGSLAADLAAAVAGEVRFDQGSRALYSNDASIYRQVPIGVVVPRDADDVVAAVEVCRRHGAPVVARGCGTGLAGQSVNAAVMIDFSKYMNRILELDPQRRVARVQPGVICDQLREAASPHGLTFAPDPATHDHCTLGGMIGNNSCGTHSVMGGKTVDNVVELEVLTYDGLRLRVGPTGDEELGRIVAGGGRRAEIYRALVGLRERYAELVRERYPDIPRRVSGYNLDDLLPEKGFNLARALVGSEATCVLVLEATVRLLPSPPARSLLVVGFPDAASAADHVPEVLAAGPVGLEFFDAGVVANLARKGQHPAGVQDLPEGSAWLLAEFGGDTEEQAGQPAKQVIERLEKTPEPPAMQLFDDPELQGKIWEVRRQAIGSTRIPGEHPGLAGWEDAAVAPERLGGYLREFRPLLDRHGYHTVLFGHFGQGCVHCRLDLDIKTADGIANFRSFLEEAADLVVAHGGSLSGEHGDGQLRGALLRKMYGPELVRAFEEFKAVWDPDNRMNPGKVVHPYRPDQNLRLGTSYAPLQLATHFSFPEDRAGFADAANRCFGVGNCRHLEGGTMCPSFMVTREEMHSTRGRARLLFEMLRQPPATRPRNAWRDPHVKEALDLCLACKGCKGECPVQVDMATYKAEFLSHWYAGRLRPPSAYALGLIPWWARLAARAPAAANLATHAPLLRTAAKAIAGIAPERELPRFAAESFRRWWERRGGMPDLDRPSVLLWPDTFNNYFLPRTAIAATEVLEAAGYRVTIPQPVLCCGRPLYDYGMLRPAKRLLRQVLHALRPQIRAGIPLVGLEPSCIAVFRDELLNLFPADEDARRLAAQSFTLGEFLEHRAPHFEPPRLARKALVQAHCHHKAVLDFDADQGVMTRLGLDYEVPDSGCCGMAGSFGYERGEHYQVSVACGERVLLPRVRETSDDTLIVADGFSCREQIRQGTGRHALHLAEVAQLALHNGDDGRADGRDADRR
jgi:FAD/FMN-containing dehydrogenase/Fe-S oxidoreductase